MPDGSVCVANTICDWLGSIPSETLTMPAFLWGSTDELDSIAPAGLGQLFVQPYRAVWIPDQRNREIMLSVLSSPKFSVTRRARVMVAPRSSSRSCWV